MTRQDAMACVDRYVRAGYRQPDDFAGAFEEWFLAFGALPLDDVDAAVSRLVRGRASSFWPTPGELSDHLQAVRAGRSERANLCPTCHGTTWIESHPWRANGGQVYEGVRRCPDCGVPPPDLSGLAGRQTPLSGLELRAWWEAKPKLIDAPASAGEFLATIRGLVARKGM